MKAENKRLNENIAILMLFLPLAMHWLLPEGPRWEQAFTTIGVGSFKYSWIVVFYFAYFLFYPKKPSNLYLKKIEGLFIIGFVLCPLGLLVMDGGSAIGLLLSAIPFYLAPCMILSRPPMVESFKILKYPLLFILIISLYFYYKGVLVSYSMGYGVDERPTTLVGPVNTSSYFIVIISCLFAELYIKQRWLKMSLLLIVTLLTIVGACRGALLVIGLYIIILMVREYKDTKMIVKIMLILSLSASIFFVFSSDLFSVLSMKNEEIAEGGDITSGRGERIALVIDKAFNDSPLVGVGHGRVFPSSKDLLVQRDERGFHYSKYEGAPHNAFVVILAERGIIGFLLVIIGVVYILLLLDYRNNLSYLVLLMMAVMANFEAILIQDDFWPLFWIIVSLSAKKAIKGRKYGNNSFLFTTVSPNTAQ